MNSSDHPLHPLFAPRSVAVVGASPKGGYGLTTLQNLAGVGYHGRLWAVHPRLDFVGGVEAFPTLSALPGVPDAIAVAVPAASTPQVLAEAASLGVRGAVVYASGFAELGQRGEPLQRQLRAACGDSLKMIGPNCLGIAGFRDRTALWGITMPYRHADTDGTVALAAQSGNMALTLMHSGRIPAVAYAVSAGNQAVLDVTDCLDYFLTDPQVRVVGLIVEGFRDLPRFRKLALQASAAGVAIAVLKVGRSAQGEKATVAHTGTLAGSDAAYGALFEQTGVIRVDDLDELVAVCTLLSGSVRPRGPRLGVFASSGGECGLIADLAEPAGVQLPELDTETARRLRELVPAYGSVGNPFDLTAGGWGDQEIYAASVAALGQCPTTDVVAFVGDAPTAAGRPQDSGWVEMVGGAGKAATELDVPVALMTTTTDVSGELVELARESGILLLAGLRPALRAIGLAGRWANGPVASTDDVDLPAVSSPDAEQVRTLLDQHPAAVLTETEAKQVISCYGISVPDGGTVNDRDSAAELAAAVGFPVVAKIVADNLAHKSDVGGVLLNLSTPAAVRDAYDRLMTQAETTEATRIHGVRIEQMVGTSGIEMIVGGRNDRAGSLVVIGAGGLLTELMADAGRLLWPYSRSDVLAVLGRLRVNRLLAGYRGAAPVDVGALIEVVLRVGRLLADHPGIAEIDINPLLVPPPGSPCQALDALIVTADPSATEEG
ncbi:acetate--CoA ligase family protein [Nakamurella lactea]|uniref:acetate--CoA ligase family protein n=1 Tax=Nakamurella lactea TaxID=459515 RepID=UPI0003FB076F|nr:acetate--CoA ligase family protein [Nakamurella lactea]